MKRLDVTRKSAEQAIAGSQAVVLRDDVNGSSLVFHSGNGLVFITLKSIIDLAVEQELPVENPPSEGSKGDDVNE